MIWPDINRNLKSVFEGGVLPTMVYINKQDDGRSRVQRPLHSHDSICEILLIYQGVGTYQVGEKRYPLEEGSVVCYNQGDLHEVSSALETEIGSYCIGITNLRKKGLNRNQLVRAGEPCVLRSGSLFPILRELCEQMYSLGDLNEGGKLASQLLCAALIVIAGQLTSYPAAVDSTAEDEQFMIRIWDHLNDHFTEDISLDTIAEALGCSSPYVSHVFKRATGSTPIQYVIRRRIGLAQTLLISTDLPATRIASMVGYDNTNYFTTLFSKIVGMTPIRYRAFYLEELKGIRNQS